MRNIAADPRRSLMFRQCHLHRQTALLRCRVLSQRFSRSSQCCWTSWYGDLRCDAPAAYCEQLCRARPCCTQIFRFSVWRGRPTPGSTLMNLRFRSNHSRLPDKHSAAAPAEPLVSSSSAVLPDVSSAADHGVHSAVLEIVIKIIRRADGQEWKGSRCQPHNAWATA